MWNNKIGLQITRKKSYMPNKNTAYECILIQ